MSLTRKVINKRKLKEPTKPQEKKNLTDLIRRNKIFSGPCYEDPWCQRNVAEMGQLKWMWGG